MFGNKSCLEEMKEREREGNERERIGKRMYLGERLSDKGGKENWREIKSVKKREKTKERERN